MSTIDSPPRPPVPCRPRDARPRAPALRDREGPADRQPAWPHRSAMVRRRRAVPGRVGAVHRARSLRVPDALQPGRRARGPRHAAQRRRPRRDRRAEDLARFAAHYHLFRGTPTRTWLDHAFSTVFGMHERLIAGQRRSTLRSHQCVPRQAGVPPARAVRALQHRGDRDDRVAARSAGAPRTRSARPGWKGRVVTAYRPDPVVDPEFDGFRAERRAIRRDHRRGHGDLGRLPRRAPQPPRVLQDAWARRRPTMVIRRRAPAICPPPNASACSIARSPARRRPTKPSCSAGRC